jgi:hypothetical protein
MVRLRQKLEQYATENEKNESIKIVIPRGDYVVKFEQNMGFSNAQLNAAELIPPQKANTVFAGDDVQINNKSRVNRQTQILLAVSSLLSAILLCLLLAVIYHLP